MGRINYGKMLTWTLVVLYFGAAIGYAVARDWRKASYFFFAGALTVTLAI